MEQLGLSELKEEKAKENSKHESSGALIPKKETWAEI